LSTDTTTLPNTVRGILESFRQHRHPNVTMPANRFVALLTTGSGERCDGLHQLAAESVPDVVCLETNCEAPFPLAFGPISDLITQLLERAHRDGEGLFARFGPELAAWAPSLV